jgi:hypothetical protein
MNQKPLIGGLDCSFIRKWKVPQGTEELRVLRILAVNFGEIPSEKSEGAKK